MVCTSRSNTGSSPCVSCHKQHLCEQSTVARKLMEGDGLPAASLIGAMAKSYLFYIDIHICHGNLTLPKSFCIIFAFYVIFEICIGICIICKKKAENQSATGFLVNAH